MAIAYIDVRKMASTKSTCNCPDVEGQRHWAGGYYGYNGYGRVKMPELTHEQMIEEIVSQNTTAPFARQAVSVEDQNRAAVLRAIDVTLQEDDALWKELAKH